MTLTLGSQTISLFEILINQLINQLISRLKSTLLFAQQILRESYDFIKNYVEIYIHIIKHWSVTQSPLQWKLEQNTCATKTHIGDSRLE
jgi:hypothetical protein